MTRATTTRILFTGYAPVHFVCFKPLYDQLTCTPGVEVFVSGGLRTKTEPKTLYDLRGMYQPFGIPPERMLTVDEIQSRDFDVLFAANTNLIMPRSVGTRIQLFHGVSFRNKAIRSENMGCDYYFVVGPYMQRRFLEAGLLSSTDPRCVPIGFPKTDLLLSSSFQAEPLRKKYGFDRERPILLYAPTGQKHNSLETMGEEVLNRLVVSGRSNMLVKLHDHPKEATVDWPAKLAAMENDRLRVADELDIAPLMRLADVLITDASSVSNEFALLDRPMVFLDVPKLLERAGRSEDSMLDLNTWGRKAGHIVEKPEDVVEIVQSSLTDSREFTNVRRAMAQDLFYHPGNATNAAMKWLSHNLLSRSATAIPVGAS